MAPWGETLAAKLRVWFGFDRDEVERERAAEEARAAAPLAPPPDWLSDPEPHRSPISPLLALAPRAPDAEVSIGDAHANPFYARCDCADFQHFRWNYELDDVRRCCRHLCAIRQDDANPDGVLGAVLAASQQIGGVPLRLSHDRLGDTDVVLGFVDDHRVLVVTRAHDHEGSARAIASLLTDRRESAGLEALPESRGIRSLIDKRASAIDPTSFTEP